MMAIVQKMDVSVSEPSPGIVAIPLMPGRLLALAQTLEQHFSSRELEDTPSLVLKSGRDLNIAAVFQAQPLGTLLGRARADWLLDVLRERRLTVVFQPIVSAANPGDLFAHECLIRGVAADGTLISAGELFAAGSAADVLFQLDLASRISAIATAQHHAIDAHIFINFNPASVYDPNYCLRSTVQAVERANVDPGRIVFEVVESAHVADPRHLINILDFYRKAGFRVALDDVGAGFSSLNLMAQLRPDFVKLDMTLIRGIDHDPYRATVARKLLEAAHELGVRTVAEGVETEEEWIWLRDNGADLAQGFFFAAPGSPPPLPRAHGFASVPTG